MEQQIQTFEAGYKRLLRHLQKIGYNIEKVIPINKFRYLIAIGTLNGNQENYLLE